MYIFSISIKTYHLYYLYKYIIDMLKYYQGIGNFRLILLMAYGITYSVH